MTTISFSIPNNKLAYITALLQKEGAKILKTELSEEEKEDIGLLKMMKKASKTKRVSHVEVLKSIDNQLSKL